MAYEAPKEDWTRPASVQRRPLNKPEKAAIWGAGIAFTTVLGLGALAAHHNAEQDKQQQPKHTGNIVRLHFDGGEGEDQVVDDLHAPGVDSSELRTAVESIEEDGSSVPAAVKDVDSGLLNQDPTAEKVLLQYGVTQEDLHPSQPK
jgi:hypothetical protein